MTEQRPWAKDVLLISVVLALIAGPVAAGAFTTGFLSNSAPTSGTIPLQANSGMTVSYACGCQMNLSTPFPASDAVQFKTENGNITLTGSGGAATVDEINGTWTNLSSLTVATNNISANPEDKAPVTVGGSLTEINFQTVTLDDGSIDLIYSSTGEGTIVLEPSATDGTAYGLVDNQTNEGLDVTVADNQGDLHFTEVPEETNTEVRVEQLGTLTVREETSPHEKITTVTATIKFFENEEDNPTIVERTAQNGEIDLTGLPVDEQFSVQVKAPGYYNRTVLINDLSQQETVFLLHKNRSAVQNRFLVDDRTGEFPPKDTELIVQKAINRSKYGGDPSGFSWTAIGGDDLGADKSFVIDLEKGDRYRLIVKSPDGGTRILGAYTAESEGVIELSIGKVLLDPTGDGVPSYTANRTNKTGESVKVNVEFNDSASNTDQLWIEIYEYKNESNVLLSNTTFAGPFGTFATTETVPDDQNQTTWVVRLTAERDGENIHAELVVGPRRPVLDQLPPWLRALLSVGSLLVVSGLFSQLNGDIGAIVVAALGGIFWYLDFLPSGVGTGVTVLALVLAGIIFINERRGGGI
jgi:hypothetical protein